MPARTSNAASAPQGGPGRPTRARSALTRRVSVFVGTKVNVHKTLYAEMSDQLRFLGSSAPRCCNRERRQGVVHARQLQRLELALRLLQCADGDLGLA